ncbi:MAG: virginiamycin lyase [Actinomycetota bacterium]|jgi:virginiamycin B lyase|nr:virginiamycin lyase [Actinomycetota bacterium]
MPVGSNASTSAEGIGLDGVIDEFPLPDRGARPHAIAAGPDGTLWFTEWAANAIGCTTPDGSICEHGLPFPGSEPHGIALGPDGAMWVALAIGAIARVETRQGASSGSETE